MWYDKLLDILTSEVFCTVLSGILVFVVSQFCLELWIKPRVEYKTIKQSILYKLKLYSNLISNPYIIENQTQEETKESFEKFCSSEYYTASNELRKLGCELASNKFKRKKDQELIDGLILLSNSMWSYSNTLSNHDESNHTCLHKLIDLLDKPRKKKVKS